MYITARVDEGQRQRVLSRFSIEREMKSPPDIPGICERDIDLLLLEELWSNPSFLTWFAQRGSKGPTDVHELIVVKQSVTQSSGESDLELTWRRLDGTTATLFIENKVDAGFQRDQAERYRQRAADAVLNSRCDTASSVLVAPAAYYGASQSELGFDQSLTYEEIGEWFRSSALGNRGLFKAGFVAAAINKATLGYNPVADDSVSRFWLEYWEISVQEAPELAMKRPASKPAGSNWIYFAPSGLPPNAWLVHKLANGAVELSLGGTGDRLGELRSTLRSHLDPDMTVDRTGKSSSIRIAVPPLNGGRAVSEQRSAVSAGLSAARQLVRWAHAKAEVLADLMPPG